MNIPLNVGTTRSSRTTAVGAADNSSRVGSITSSRAAASTGTAPSRAAASSALSRTAPSKTTAASSSSSGTVGTGAARAGPPPASVASKSSSDTSQASWLPSQKLKSVKCADPFASKATHFKTKFGSVYNSGGVPCRLNHGAVNIKLQWSRDPGSLDLDPLLVTCAEGLCETEHPYAFAARECFRELLAADPDGARALPLVPRIVPCLRAALTSANRGVFEGGVEAATQLSEVVGAALNADLHVLVVPMHRKHTDREFAGKILKALQTFEEKGGPDAYKAIKAKVPTYCSIHI